MSEPYSEREIKLLEKIEKYKTEVKQLNLVVKNLTDVKDVTTYQDFRDKRNHVVTITAGIISKGHYITNEHIVQDAIKIYNEINNQLKLKK